MKIQSALISVYYKDGLEPIVRLLDALGVKIYSTGGTQQFITSLGIDVIPVENITDYPSIFGGRVKTLHPKIFGGILHRRGHQTDSQEVAEYEIPAIDLVVVDLYPFEQTVASGASEEDSIEKIDIGGISLIRAAAKNFNDVLIVSSRNQYADLLTLLEAEKGNTTIEQRKKFAAYAFHISSHYDTAIFNYFNANLPSEEQILAFKQSIMPAQSLRYGENPHQKAEFYGDLNTLFDQLNGKELSFNNLVDTDAALDLIDEFEQTAFAIIKHTNACGMATGKTAKEAYLKALAADPVSAFGGVIATNTTVDIETAEELNKLFFEILVAPAYTEEALTLLKSKKNRILLLRKPCPSPKRQFKTLLNGAIVQDKDLKSEKEIDLQVVTNQTPTQEQIQSLLFANKLVKHTKSNTIILAENGQLFASGVGQTSRVDALRQAILKAKTFGFDLTKAVMASDAFFPFPDCVEIAHEAGIKAVIQPGGSIKDKDSIDFCNQNNMAMVFTGTRHFKH